MLDIFVGVCVLIYVLLSAVNFSCSLRLFLSCFHFFRVSGALYLYYILFRPCYRRDRNVICSRSSRECLTCVTRPASSSYIALHGLSQESPANTTLSYSPRKTTSTRNIASSLPREGTWNLLAACRSSHCPTVFAKQKAAFNYNVIRPRNLLIPSIAQTRIYLPFFQCHTGAVYAVNAVYSFPIC